MSAPCKHCRLRVATRIHKICQGCGFPICPKKVDDDVYIVDYTEKFCSIRCEEFVEEKKEVLCE